MIHNGTYTITSPTGEHRTFRIKTQPEGADFAPGRRVIGLLTGPNNEHDYTNFGFVSDDNVRVWRKFCGTQAERSFHEKCAELIWDLCTNGTRGRFYCAGFRLELEARCMRCNRKLTHPESLRTGLGPECGGRI